MISGDVTVTDGDKSWSITPDQIASYMGFRSEDEERRLHPRALHGRHQVAAHSSTRSLPMWSRSR